MKYFYTLLLIISFFVLPLSLQAGPKSVSIYDAAIAEGSSGTVALVFTVETTDVANGDSVDFRIDDGSATASNSDYVDNSGTITFVGNDQTQTVSVTINSDTKVERDETFFVILSNPSGGGITNIADGNATGTITDDDNIPTALSTPENSTTVTTLGADADADYSIIGGDDSAKLSLTTAGVLTFISAPDYEHPTDTNSDNIYEIQIQLDDTSGIIETQNVSVTVTNENSDLTITQSDSQDPVLIGQNFSYIIHSSNLGPDLAEGITVIDNLPAGATYQGLSATNWSCGFLAGRVTCNYDLNLTSGASASDITINVTAPGVDGNITNSVEISSFTDSNLSNNTVDESTRVSTNASDLSVTISSAPHPNVTTTETITYTIDVENLGPNTVEEVSFTNPLPSGLNFISIDDGDNGNSWSCSTGSKIICDYIGNGGTLNVGVSTSSVTIVTRAPNIATTITSSVTVICDSADLDTTNNTATTSTNVITGLVTGGEEDFSKYLQYNIFGDMLMINNANINKPPADADNNYNDNIDMTYVDTGFSSSNFTIFNSSSSTLTLDPTYEILWAGLYWQGRVQASDWTNSTYSDYADAKAHMHQVLLKTPNSNDYVAITANKLNSFDRSVGSNTVYGAFADVTSLLDNNETGVYSVANIVSCEGTGGGGNYGGWTMMVIYEDPFLNLDFKNVSVFNGFVYVNTPATDDEILIEGFVTPDTGTITSSIAYFGADGDPTPGGSAKTQVGNAGAFFSINGDTNLLNSESTGIPGRTYGIDADRVDVSNYIVNGQTSATFLFDAGVVGVLDYYTLNMFSFVTDMYTPIINDMDKSATINNLPVGPGSVLRVGDILTYTIHFENDGTGETAIEVEIFDDFDQDNLSTIFDVSNFDASTIKLSNEGGSANGWDSSADCGYDNIQSKVWCKINSIPHGDSYDMQFDVSIKYAPNQDMNVTNTAYAKYKNATTGSYLEIVTCGSELCGGASNNYNAGTIGASGIIQPVGGDMIDTSITTFIQVAAYNASTDSGSSTGVPGSTSLKFIRTKKAEEIVSLIAVHLDDTGQALDFNNAGQDVDRALWMMIPVLNNINITGNCPALNSNQLQQLIDDATGEQAVMILRDYGGLHDYSVSADIRIPANATTNAKIEFIVVDTSKMNQDAQNCLAVSSTTGNLEGLGQCINSEVQYVDGYGQTAWDRCVTNTQYGQPCLSSNHGYGTGLFNTPLGCLMCTFYAGTACSSDDFSIRPDRFDITSSHPHMPDLLRAGSEYTTTIHAYTSGTTNDTQGYIQNSASIGAGSTKWLSTGVEDNGTLPFQGEPSLSDFNITNGLSTYGGTSGEVAKVSYGDVGHITLNIEDQNWAIIDNDDTPQDCNGTLICGGKDLTFIPHHFGFNDINITNNNGLPGTFTYISDLNDTNQSTFNMAARIQVKVIAQNESNGATLNFDSGAGFYEHNISINSVVSHIAHGNADKTFIPFIQGNPAITTALLGGFGNGEKTLAWNDTNLSQVLRFNFPREVNTTINPFVVTASDVNLSLLSTYTGVAPSSPADIIGTKDDGLGDGNTTMVYGRSHAGRQRYVGPMGIANIYYEVYCFETDTSGAGGVTCDTGLLDDFIAPNLQRTDDIRWFRNEVHAAANDGNIGLVAEKGNLNIPTIATDTIHVTPQTNGNPATATLTYDVSRGYPYKTTMENNASRWLIYNEDNPNATRNQFSVEFDILGTWSGERETTTTTKDPGTVRTNRRSMW